MNSKSSLRKKEIEALLPAKVSKSFAPPSASDMADRASLESFLYHADYQPQSYISDCKSFGFDPEHPRFPSNSPTFQFKSWQVTGMRRMMRILDNPIVQACLLVDATGLDKTTKIQRGLAVARCEQLLEDYNEKKELYERWNAARNAIPTQNPFAIPDLPIRPLSPKPILLVVLPELIEQWATEIKKFSEDFKVLIYHGGELTSNFGVHEKISAKPTKGKLTRDHPIFNGDEENSRVVVITSVVTMLSRHGPTALKNYRMHHLEYMQQDADDLITVNDSN
ncbi:uncharacterized protein EAE97_002470 [Botrytis byssoidea]|uniref:SNF2 N-terminal domain-containing protein n=1 Tax=Botrytis byssoidea TaxID=139641 RepID=A0A9P5IR77_9HELO|nr:uncharacterized protein EAE97_002470 [Botrytis byssoidea]KAF7950918.1 hypothetical protein EAE97_002470 [Botrytis byssoidea]